jgi:hypothetical protein
MVFLPCYVNGWPGCPELPHGARKTGKSGHGISASSGEFVAEFWRCDHAPGIRIPQPSHELGLPWLIGQPFLLELHRAYISQRRVQPSAAVTKQPGNSFISRVAPGLKALSVQFFHLQRPEQRFFTGVDAPMSSDRCSQECPV